MSQKSVGGRDLTYIDKRSLANRLDSVLGPDGWRAEYRDAGGRGMICKLFLYVPLPDGTWGWMAKEDCGSDEEMTKKQGGQQIDEVDNSFKFELTNAFRRAAQDAWGIGRYLYQKGIPLFLNPSMPRSRPRRSAARSRPRKPRSHRRPPWRARSTRRRLTKPRPRGRMPPFRLPSSGRSRKDDLRSTISAAQLRRPRNA